MSNGDVVGGLLIRFIKAGEGFTSIGWLVISGSNLPVDEIKKRFLQNMFERMYFTSFTIVCIPLNILVILYNNVK